MKSRWANDEDDAAAAAQKKREKEEKRRAKTDKQRKVEEAERRLREEAAATARLEQTANVDESTRAPKRRKLSPEREEDGGDGSTSANIQLLRFAAPEWGPYRHVDNYEKLNHIEEGSYGWVSRAKEVATGEIVALKRLKMDNANDGFPVTGLREIETLLQSRHSNIVNLREVVIGDQLDEYVRCHSPTARVPLSQLPIQRLPRHGLHRARSQDAARRYAGAVPSLRD